MWITACSYFPQTVTIKPRLLYALAGEVYSNTVSELKSTPASQLTWTKLRGDFLGAEQKERLKRKKDNSAVSSESEDEEKDMTALIAKAYKEGMAQGLVLFTSSAGFKSHSNNKREKCSGCGKSGHGADKCWKLHPELIPDWAKNKGGTSRS